jgi:DNA-binding MarR family transcriptional regulator
LLRLLVDELDGDVDRAYREQGINFRPRFTPIARLLAELGPLRIKEIADRTGLSHSAISQTVSEMRRLKLIDMVRGADGRERIVRLSPTGEEMLPKLRRQWSRTAVAAQSLNREIGVDLEQVMLSALAALDRQPFAARMTDRPDIAS